MSVIILALIIGGLYTACFQWGDVNLMSLSGAVRDAAIIESEQATSMLQLFLKPSIACVCMLCVHINITHSLPFKGSYVTHARCCVCNHRD